MNGLVGKNLKKISFERPLEIGKLVLPFALGLIVLWILLDRIDSENKLDLRVLFDGVAPAYKLATVAYAIFGASITVVIIGTLIYLIDINKFSKDVKGPGEYLITGAFYFAISTIIAIFVGLGYWKAYSNVGPNDICSGHDVMLNFHRHDLFVIYIFVAFLVLDFLTSIGLGRAVSAATDDEDRKRRLCDARQWARAQLWLIDLPVLTGAVILYFAMPALAEGSWRVLDHNLVNDPGKLEIFAVGTSGLTSLRCDTGSAFPLHEFIGNMYVAGVGTGALAAQIFLSQAVFVMLGFFFRLKRINDPA